MFNLPETKSIHLCDKYPVSLVKDCAKWNNQWTRDYWVVEKGGSIPNGAEGHRIFACAYLS